MTGGPGNDTFVFGKDFGKDVIADFTAGPGAGNVISFAKSLFANFAAVRGNASLNGSNGVVITLDADNTVTLDNVHKLAALHTSDFSFF